MSGLMDEIVKDKPAAGVSACGRSGLCMLIKILYCVFSIIIRPPTTNQPLQIRLSPLLPP